MLWNIEDMQRWTFFPVGGIVAAQLLLQEWLLASR